jgi:protein ImuB
MASRPLRKSDARVVRLPTSLRSVEAGREPAESAQLWVGAHMVSLGTSATLEKLATRAQKFTPRVSLVPPDGLLLEVKGSLHLFNGVEGLLRAFGAECQVLGIESITALAPTPLAALVAARVGDPFVVTNEAQLVGRLSSMPLTPLRWPEDVISRLARMGVRTIGQTLRLPRAGFARRFGPVHLAELDRLTGRNADLRHHFQPRERFRRRRELTYEMENKETILAALAPMLADLGRFLETRQVGITELECRLRHRHAVPSECVLRLAAPLANVERLTELLGERLNALVLPEPVRSLVQRSGLPSVS